MLPLCTSIRRCRIGSKLYGGVWGRLSAYAAAKPAIFWLPTGRRGAFWGSSPMLEGLTGDPTTGPSPLEIVAAEPSGYVDGLTNRVKPWYVPGLHGL